METADLMDRLHSKLSRELLIDLYDAVSAKALQAHEIIRDHAELDDKRSREATGQLRFRMQEKAFHDICERHGGWALTDGVIPGSELRVFQPYMRFSGDDEPGVILGLATMQAPETLPVKNQSRLAGVSLNSSLTPQLDLDGRGPQVGDVFVLFLISRDRSHPGKIDEVAIGTIDSDYESFVAYKPIEAFLSGYAGLGRMVRDEPAEVKLKVTPKRFQPPEHEDKDESGYADDSDA